MRLSRRISNLVGPAVIALAVLTVSPVRGADLACSTGSATLPACKCSSFVGGVIAAGDTLTVDTPPFVVDGLCTIFGTVVGDVEVEPSGVLGVSGPNDDGGTVDGNIASEGLVALGDAAVVTGNVVQRAPNPFFPAPPFDVWFIGTGLGATVGGDLEISGGGVFTAWDLSPLGISTTNEVKGSIRCLGAGTVFPQFPGFPPDCSDWDGDDTPDGTIRGRYQCLSLDLACATTIPFAEFFVEKGKVKLHKTPNRDRFDIRGVALGDGFDPATEDVTVSFGESCTDDVPPVCTPIFIQTISGSDFLRNDDDDGWEFKGTGSGVKKIEIDDNGDFRIDVRDVDLSGIYFPEIVPFSWQVGNELGQFGYPFDEKGRLE